MSGLAIENLSMRFDLPNGTSVQALQDVSLHLKEGELMSVLGPSGCGKTTLLNIVAGFLAPTEGQIVLNGHQVTGPAAERGMVFQQGALFVFGQRTGRRDAGRLFQHLQNGPDLRLHLRGRGRDANGRRSCQSI